MSSVCKAVESRRSVLTRVGSVGLLASAWLLGFATPAVRAAESDEDETRGVASRIEEVVVTASPLGRSSEALAVPVQVLSRDEVLDQAGATLGEALRSRPGITTSSFAAGASRPVIRGQDQLRVRVLENGVGTGDVSSISPDHGVTINPLVARRVEVVQGPATLRYGGGAIGGVVNALTNRVPTERVERPFSGELYSAYGIGARERNLAGLLEGDAGPVAWHLDALSVDSRDYDVPGSPGHQFNTASDGYAFSGGAAWQAEAFRIGGSITRNRNDYGIPAPEDPAFPSFISLEQDHYAFELDARPDFGTGPGEGWIEELRIRGARTEYQHDEVVEGEGVAARFDNEDLEVRGELVHAPVGPFEGALGVQFQTVRFEADGEAGELLPPSKTDLVGVYLFESLALGDRLGMEVAARVERVRVDGTDLGGSDAARSFNPRSVSASWLYQVAPEWDLGLTLTVAARAPDALELFSQGPHDATETFEFGDPDLDEEQSRTADLLLRGSHGPLSGQVNLFFTDYHNFTFGRFTGTSRDEDGTRFGDPDSGELRDLVYTQEDATFLGAEVQLAFALMDWGDARLELELQGDFVRARLGSSGNVPRIPPLRWGMGLVYSSERVSGRIGFLQAQAQDDVAAFESRTSGYTTVDGSLRVRLGGSPERPIEAVVSLRNLLDARARNAVSFKKDDVLLPGRDIRLGLHVRF